MCTHSGAIRLRIVGVGSWKKAATQLAQNGSALARTSLGSGFWLAAALALLACSDAIRRISTHPLWRWLLHMQIAIIPLWLLYSGTLNDLSLMKNTPTVRMCLTTRWHNI